MALPALQVLARTELTQAAAEAQEGLLDQRVQRRQAGEQHLDVVDLQRRIVAVADLALEGDGADVGVPAQAVEVDVLRILDEVAAGGRAGIGDRGTRHEGQAAVVAQVVQAELGVAQLGGEVAQGHAELAEIAGFAIRRAREGGAAARIGGRRGAADVEVGRLVDQTEVQHHELAADQTEVVVGEVGARGLHFGLRPLQQVQGFQREVLGQVERGEDRVDRQEGFLQLSARHTQTRNVDRVDDVDATLDEGAFAPAHHLATEAEVAGEVVGDDEIAVDEGVKQAGALADAILGRVGDVIPAHRLEIVEAGGAHEGAPVGPVHADLGGDAERIRDQVALVVLQVARRN